MYGEVTSISFWPTRRIAASPTSSSLNQNCRLMSARSAVRVLWGRDEMLSMGKDGATVVDMVAEWLEDNDFDGLTDGRCHCSGRDLMHCGLVRSRRCSAAHLFPCTRCTHLTTCDRTTGADMYSTNRHRC